MAMEIDHSKNLHKAALPVLVVILLVLIASIAIIYKSDEIAKIGKGLTSRPFRIEPHANGFSKFSLNSTSEKKFETIGESGRSAELFLEFQ